MEAHDLILVVTLDYCNSIRGVSSGVLCCWMGLILSYCARGGTPLCRKLKDTVSDKRREAPLSLCCYCWRRLVEVKRRVRQPHRLLLVECSSPL